MKLNNYEELVEDLASILMEIDKDLPSSQIDVYLYVEDGKGELDQFINAGGNSWRDDNHYTLCKVDRTTATMFDAFETKRELAEVAGYDDFGDFINDVAEYADCYPTEVSKADCIRFIEDNNALFYTLTVEYKDRIDKAKSDYTEQAVQIIDRFLAEQEETWN